MKYVFLLLAGFLMTLAPAKGTRPVFDGFLVSLEEHTMQGLAAATNDLIKEGFSIRHIKYHEKRTLILTDTGNLRNPGPDRAKMRAKEVVAKYNSIRRMELNWIIRTKE